MPVGSSKPVLFLNSVFGYRKGRPFALFLALALLALNVATELPDRRPATRTSLETAIDAVGEPFKSGRQYLFDSYQRAFPRQPASQPVTVVAIDESSLAETGQWPWPRNQLARLVDAIAAHRPAAIGLEFYFPEPDQTSPHRIAANLPGQAALARELSRLPSHDQILAASLRKAPTVLGAAGLEAEEYSLNNGLRIAPLLVNGVDGVGEVDAARYVRDYPKVLTSLPELQGATRGQAMLSVDLENGVLRRIPLVVGFGGQLVPGMALEMLRVATGAAAAEVQVGRHGLEHVKVSDLVIPVQPFGDIWLHYASLRDTSGRYVAAADVLGGRIEGEQLAGKLVLVGLTGTGLNSVRTTALGEVVPSVEIQAQTMEALYDGDFILRPWWMKWVETIVLLIICLLMIRKIPQTDSTVSSFLESLPRASILLVLLFNVAVTAIGYVLFHKAGLIFDAVAYLIVTLSVMGSLIASAKVASDTQARALAMKESQLEKQRAELATQLEDLVDGLVKLIAGAIDAKNPSTGRHCERVPALGLMLADAANRATDGPFANFRFETEDDWREFRIGAWLHDCGKVTTPEYVIDKATKLETIYNRIHEVRTRFEVLLRDAMIARLETVAAGGDPRAAAAAFDARRAQLIDDFAFLAECNLGAENMAPEKLARLRRIAGETWLRHFDDRLGLGQDELARYVRRAPAAADSPDRSPDLPVRETLLTDKPYHIIEREQEDRQILDPQWGFKMEIPDHLYNYGELYNMAIGRGTLTEEERFKINEHVMHSLMMLEQLPFPGHLEKVPAYAGTHHETLMGSGYPRRLAAENLSVPMRIMAIADIFEALTASDRPYKTVKTLSESIEMLYAFKVDGQIDGDLFDLFLSSGVYLRFAERHLLPEQIDAVDLGRYLG